MSGRSAIPVMYYHSVGDHPRPRRKSFLTMPNALFEEQLRRLKAEGFRSVFCQDLYDFVQGKRQLSSPEIVLMFDDGYLDNWVHVWPLAKKYGFKFTIVVNPEFVDPRDIVRPTLEDVWAGRAKQADLHWWGFLSWAEMRLMEASGLVEIQSHALTHTWYPVSGEIVDFHHPDDPYQWLIWNRFPETKPFWLTEYNEELVPYGTPVYRFRKSIEGKRYLPDPRLDEVLAEHVAGGGGKQYFARAEWKSELQRVADDFRKADGDTGRMETDAEYEDRLRQELAGSRRAIEQALNKEVRFLCWPGGGVNATARRVAEEAGYLATTKGSALNRPGANPAEIARVSSWFGGRIPDAMKWWLFHGQLDRASGARTVRGAITDVLSRAQRAGI